MANTNAEKLKNLASKIKSYPNFPKEGVLFRDIFSALADGPTCKLLKEVLVDAFRSHFPDAEAIIGLESRGFLFSFTLAAEFGISCMPVRKPGKIPGEILSYKYTLEYGTDTFEMQKGPITKGMKCVIVDDFIATGGSLNAAINLIRQCQGDVLGCLCVIEIEGLKGRDNLPNIPVHSILKY